MVDTISDDAQRRDKAVDTYTGATEVAGPASTGSTGKGTWRHDCSMSRRLRPAGMCARVFAG